MTNESNKRFVRGVLVVIPSIAIGVGVAVFDAVGGCVAGAIAFGLCAVITEPVPNGRRD